MPVLSPVTRRYLVDFSFRLAVFLTVLAVYLLRPDLLDFTAGRPGSTMYTIWWRRPFRRKRPGCCCTIILPPSCPAAIFTRPWPNSDLPYSFDPEVYV